MYISGSHPANPVRHYTHNTWTCVSSTRYKVSHQKADTVRDELLPDPTDVVLGGIGTLRDERTRRIQRLAAGAVLILGKLVSGWSLIKLDAPLGEAQEVLRSVRKLLFVADPCFGDQHD